MSKVSVLIPSRHERFLQETVSDVLSKSRGDIEVIVALDGYWPDPPLKDDPRLIVLHTSEVRGMREQLNGAAATARGDYLFKLDAHCMLAEGFDITLAAECEPDWIVIPRRYSLDPEAWAIREGRPVIDYEFMNFPYKEFTSVRQGGKWYERAAERADIMLDENMTFQGSAYFMRRSYAERLGPLQTEGYGSLIMESDELGNKCWLSGGRVMTNKRTWYAHLHKGKQYGRMYFINKWELRRGRKYGIDFWMNNRHLDRWPWMTRKIDWLIEHFWPLPYWPEDWRDPKWEREYLKSIGELPADAA